jgi:nicotinamide-nucleotide amidase
MELLGVSREVLAHYGAVSLPVAGMMTTGVRKLMNAHIAVSVTGLAGPDGDEFGHPVGTVYIGYEDSGKAVAKKFLFAGDRESIRNQAIVAALSMILENNK